MKDNSLQYLELKRLDVKPRLAELIPPDLARRYHALPVSKEGEKITVVMADPNDSEARQAVLNTLGPSTHIVKADLRTIDDSLDEIWPDPPPNFPLILVLPPTQKKAAEVNSYAQEIATLLNSRVSQFICQGESRDATLTLTTEVERLNSHLVIFSIPERSVNKRSVPKLNESTLLDQMPTSLLVVRNPRWPIEKMLLVIRNEDTDEAAIDWAVLMARRCDAAITVLPVVPPIPLMYAGLKRMNYSPTTLLASNCPLGRKIRQITHRLNEWEIKGMLRLCDETPDLLIQSEVSEGDYDLIVIASEPHNRIRKWVLGNMMNTLLKWTDRPVLIAQGKYK